MTVLICAWYSKSCSHIGAAYKLLLFLNTQKGNGLIFAVALCNIYLFVAVAYHSI